MTHPSPAPTAPQDDRLMDLEIKISFMQDLLETLNRQVYEQQLQLDQVSSALQRLREQGTVNGSTTGMEQRAVTLDAAAERPPHY